MFLLHWYCNFKMYDETEGVLEGGYYILAMSKNGEIVQY